MKRLVPFAVALVLLAGLAGATTPALAQDRTVELAVGPQYPLMSRLIEVDQELGWHVRLGLRIRPRIWLNFTWENLPTGDDLGYDKDVDFDFYGIGTTFVLNGEEGFRLIGVLNAGAGNIDFQDPPEETGKPADSRIDFWYEAGFGALFDSNERIVFRLQLTYRRLSPKHPNLIMEGSRGMIVPSFDVAFRF